jgi:hypothetical protein
MFYPEDQSFVTIGRAINRSEDSAKTRVRKILERLTDYYERVDRKNGISETASTIDRAMQKLDPKLP